MIVIKFFLGIMFGLVVQTFMKYQTVSFVLFGFLYEGNYRHLEFTLCRAGYDRALFQLHWFPKYIEVYFLFIKVYAVDNRDKPDAHRPTV